MGKSTKKHPKYKVFMSQKMYFLGLVLLFLSMAFCAYFITNNTKGSEWATAKSSQTQIKPPSEIDRIKKAKTTDERARIYLRLIERVGPEKAQDFILHSGLPHNGNTHLVNHTVGDYLYKKYGPEGIVYCKDYFSSSCYHGIIINSLGDGELEKIKIMMEACRKRGDGVLGQCVHGLGHGLLTYVGYANLLDALSLCDEVGQGIDKFNFYLCHNGVFMENIWGVHEGEPSSDRWVKEEEDIHYPCNDPRIDDKYLGACWYNQHTIIRSYYQGDISKVGEECYELANKNFQRECFEGLFNTVQAKSQGNVDSQFKDCNLMPKEWLEHCLTTQIIVELSHGGYNSSFEICSRIELQSKSKCYQMLSDMILAYFKTEQQGELCMRIPREFRQGKCEKYI